MLTANYLSGETVSIAAVSISPRNMQPLTMVKSKIKDDSGHGLLKYTAVYVTFDSQN